MDAKQASEQLGRVPRNGLQAGSATRPHSLRPPETG